MRSFEEFGSVDGAACALFAMLPANDVGTRFAKQYPIANEDYRDNCGHPSNEPPRPDIATVRAWPQSHDLPHLPNMAK
jgi:hypothetical protein